MKLFKEFKEFAVKGNMMDMAVGIIIGAAFNKVVDVMVKQVLMPPLSILTGSIELKNRKLVLSEKVIDENGKVLNEEIAIGFGALFEALLDFFIIGFTIFIVIKFFNKILRKAEDTKDKTIATPKDIQLLTEMTQLMEEQNKILRTKV